MACGKTTLGRALEAAGFADFIDLDEQIEARTGLTPGEWFAERGEEAFRAAELQVLHDIIASNRHAVVAAGGGTPCSAGAMDLMLRSGTVVWLEASLERTVNRLAEADGTRPIVAGMNARALREFVPGHLESRIPYYSRAHLRFDSSRLDTQEEISQSVARFIQLFSLHLNH